MGFFKKTPPVVDPIETDPATGMPKLPDGWYFEVIETINRGDKVLIVRLYDNNGESLDDRYVDDYYFDLITTFDAYTTKYIARSARIVYARAMAEVESAAVRAKVVGRYPPKSLNG